MKTVTKKEDFTCIAYDEELLKKILRLYNLIYYYVFLYYQYIFQKCIIETGYMYTLFFVYFL